MSLDSSRAWTMGVTYTSPVNAAAGALAVAAGALSSMSVLLVVGLSMVMVVGARRGAGSWRRRGLEAVEQFAGRGGQGLSPQGGVDAQRRGGGRGGPRPRDVVGDSGRAQVRGGGDGDD